MSMSNLENINVKTASRISFEFNILISTLMFAVDTLIYDCVSIQKLEYNLEVARVDNGKDIMSILCMYYKNKICGIPNCTYRRQSD